MEAPVPREPAALPGRGTEPLLALILEQDGLEVVRYFTDDEAADAAVPADSIQAALDLAGAWSDLDWDQMVNGLDRIRHETPPSAPLSL